VLIRHLIFPLAVILVVGITCNRWCNSQSISQKLVRSTLCYCNGSGHRSTQKLWGDLVFIGKTTFHSRNSPPVHRNVRDGRWWHNETAASQKIVQSSTMVKGRSRWSHRLAWHIKHGSKHNTGGGTNYWKVTSHFEIYLLPWSSAPEVYTTLPQRTVIPPSVHTKYQDVWWKSTKINDDCLLYRARSKITKLLIPTHAHFHWLKFIKNI